MDKLKTATGRELECDYFNPFPSAGQVNLRVIGASLPSVAQIFSDSRETVQLWCGGVYASGYTRLVAIVPESGAIRVVLGKE